MFIDEDICMILLCDRCGGQEVNLIEDGRVMCANIECDTIIANLRWNYTEFEEEYNDE